MRESRRRLQIALTVLLVAGLAPPIWPVLAVAQTSSGPAREKADERPLIGGKIYELRCRLSRPCATRTCSTESPG